MIYVFARKVECGQSCRRTSIVQANASARAAQRNVLPGYDAKGLPWKEGTPFPLIQHSRQREYQGLKP
jgi:hypothetical protein